MIFVGVGTHHQPFDRLLRAADAAARALGEPLVAQRGPSTVPLCGEVHDMLGPAAFERYLVEARIVVLHAGSSSFLQARALGRWPVLVPRRPEHREHVDDHQVRFVRTLSAADALVVEPEGLLSALQGYREPPGRPGGASEAFGARLDVLVRDIVRRGAPPRRARRVR